MTEFVTRSKKLTLWQSCYISLAWRNEWLPLKSQKPCHHGAVTTWGSVFLIFDSLCDRIWLLYSNDTWSWSLHVLPSFNKYLTVKLMDNLISQSSTGGKSSFCESWLANLQASVPASLKPVHCDHIMEKLLSDWLKCVLKLPHQGRALTLTQIERDTGQYGCIGCVSIRNCQISWWKQVAPFPKFYEVCLRLHRTCWNAGSMKGLINFPRKIKIIWESFSWFYPVASMSDFYHNVSSRVFLFIDGPM